MPAHMAYMPARPSIRAYYGLITSRGGNMPARMATCPPMWHTCPPVCSTCPPGLQSGHNVWTQYLDDCADEGDDGVLSPARPLEIEG